MTRHGIDTATVHGFVAPGFEEVRREFEANFARRGELGAACAVFHRGQKVVDLWGGYRDANTGAPWEEDTMVIVFSATKGMSALALAVAHSRGLLDYDEQVATYWPEFAQNGKQRITVRQLLSHQAGLSAIDEPLDLQALADLDRLAEILARQKPAWEPGTRHGYHAVSLGFYENELLRRVDPRRRSLGRFFSDEIAQPLGLEFYIGLPPKVPLSRMAALQFTNPLSRPAYLKMLPTGIAIALPQLKSLAARTWHNPSLATVGDFTNPGFRNVELPASGGIGPARSIARAYSAFATGGSELGIRPATIEALAAPPVLPTRGCRDLVMGIQVAYSLGVGKPAFGFQFGSSPRSFGWPGLGGSFGFADPDAQIGYGYVMNKMQWYFPADPREKALRDAVYRCLG